MTDKIIGYCLVTLGLIIIFVALINVYGVFTGMYKPVNIFHFEGIGVDTAAFLPKELADQGFVPEKPKAEFISASVLNDTSNLFAHLIFMGFIASSGYKIASIGTYLVRTIKVNLKEEKSKP